MSVLLSMKKCMNSLPTSQDRSITIRLTNPKVLNRLTNRFRRLLSPPPRLKVSEWADRFGYLPAKGNAVPGKYQVNRTPYQRAMMDDAVDPMVIEFFWMIGRQLGKTLSHIFII